MKELKIKLYKFSELSDEAKTAVCDKERESADNFGTMAQESSAYERKASLDAFCELFGIDYEIEFDYDYPSIKWNMDNPYEDNLEKDEVKGKYLLRYLNQFYYKIRSPKYLFLRWSNNHDGSLKAVSKHSKIQWTELECPFTGVCYDNDLLYEIMQWYKKPNMEITLEELMEQCIDRFEESWCKEMDYQMSDESIGEAIEANWSEKLYYEDGTEYTGPDADAA